MGCIIVIGGKAGAGKSTVAKIIQEYYSQLCMFNTRICPMAESVKRIAKEIYFWNGIKDDEGRQLLQDIGTLGRKYNKDTWIKHWLNTNDPLSGIIIIDDIRFENEVLWLCSMVSDNIIKLLYIDVIGRKYDLGELGKHESEQGTGMEPDCIIDNSGSIDDLKPKITSILEKFIS